jgi:hypothetical protein
VSIYRQKKPEESRNKEEKSTLVTLKFFPYKDQSRRDFPVMLPCLFGGWVFTFSF